MGPVPGRNAPTGPLHRTVPDRAFSGALIDQTKTITAGHDRLSGRRSGVPIAAETLPFHQLADSRLRPRVPTFGSHLGFSTFVDPQGRPPQHGDGDLGPRCVPMRPGSNGCRRRRTAA